MMLYHIGFAALSLACLYILLLWTSSKTNHISANDQRSRRSVKDIFPIPVVMLPPPANSAEYPTSDDGSNSLNDANALEHRLPQAIIIGVKKGGTRALLEYLRLHPDVRATGPELHFFNKYYDRGLDWYRKQMPLTTSNQLTVEKTPAYFIQRAVPQRIFQMCPTIKLLMVVRDPITRAISDYTQMITKRNSSKTFEEIAFLDSNAQTVNTHWGGIKIGLYAKHLQKWLQYFPLNQILFVSGENMIADPLTEMKKVETFLGLIPQIREDQFVYNATKGFPCIKKDSAQLRFKCLGKTKGRRHPEIAASSLQKLSHFFRPHNQKFYHLVSRDFGWT